MQIYGVALKIKTAIKTGGFICFLLLGGNAIAASNCMIDSTHSGVALWSPADEPGSCKTYVTTYYQNTDGEKGIVKSCTECNSGFTQVSAQVPHCSNDQRYYRCVCKCNDCESTGYVSYSTTHEHGVNARCACSTGSAVCTKTDVYRCKAGYYGTPSNGTSGCTKCPTAGNTNIAGNSNREDNADITSCFISKNKTITDNSGSYVFTSDCYYAE